MYVRVRVGEERYARVRVCTVGSVRGCVDRPTKLIGGKRLVRGRLTLTRRPSDCAVKPREEKKWI